MDACTEGESCTQLRHFCSNYSRHHEVDNALERIGDKSLIAEVSHFCGTMDTMDVETIRIV
jgi:hypothetical protein